ncbi:MAG: hypothetical protein ABW032_06575 [Burkholderiaceae bacterium]
MKTEPLSNPAPLPEPAGDDRRSTVAEPSAWSAGSRPWAGGILDGLVPRTGGAAKYEAFLGDDQKKKFALADQGKPLSRRDIEKADSAALKQARRESEETANAARRPLGERQQPPASRSRPFRSAPQAPLAQWPSRPQAPMLPAWNAAQATRAPMFRYSSLLFPRLGAYRAISNYHREKSQWLWPPPSSSVPQQAPMFRYSSLAFPPLGVYRAISSYYKGQSYGGSQAQWSAWWQQPSLTPAWNKKTFSTSTWGTGPGVSQPGLGYSGISWTPPYSSSISSQNDLGTPGVARLGLGEEIDRIFNKSPKLQSDWSTLSRQHWRIEYGRNGGGSFADRQQKTITVDGSKRNDPAAVVSTLSHELGHAMYDYVEDTSSRENYVRGCLADEGAAELNRLRARREILDNGGPNIGSPSSNHVAYNAIYDDFLRDGDVVKARHAIGAIFRNGERTSGTFELYGDYYGSFYDRNHDAGTSFFSSLWSSNT